MSRAISVPASVSVAPIEVAVAVVVGKAPEKKDAAACTVWKRNVLFDASFASTIARVDPAVVIAVDVVCIALVSAK
jgi:hypothetical protein